MTVRSRIDELLRKGVAFQLAMIEFENSDIADEQAIKAIEQVVAEIVKGVKQLKKEMQ